MVRTQLIGWKGQNPLSRIRWNGGGGGGRHGVLVGKYGGIWLTMGANGGRMGRAGEISLVRR